MKYKVNAVYSTVQGEGCLTGTPIFLLRLQGCSVGCPWCDTKETWTVEPQHQVNDFWQLEPGHPYWIEKTQSEIVQHLTNYLQPGPTWVMLTGGEPAQQDLKSLVIALHDAGYKVSLETSGTATGHIGANLDWVCVSPKFGMPGGRSVLAEAVRKADELKFVVGKKLDLIRILQFLKDHPLKPGCQICLQPLSFNEKATQLCIETVITNGWRLSLQMHKYLGLP